MAFVGQALLGLLLSALVVSISLHEHSCPDTFFDCKNQRCIASFFVCDDDNDCGNFEDEINCFANETTSSNVSLSDPIIKCPDNHFACNDLFHSCVPQHWVCDGIRECSNGADERNCTERPIDCGDDYRCTSGDECIPKTWLCDTFHDCSDNSDELNCTHVTSAEVNCDQEHGRYECVSGECIDYSKRCDGHRDCLLGDDEGVQCHLQACNDKKCSHICAQNPSTNRTQCLCPSGFQLKNLTTCVDYDECSDNKLTNMCSQQCINLEGSHRCSCDSGYKLVNQSKCIVEKGPAVIFYSFSDQIRSYELKENRVAESFTGSPGETIAELDIDIARRKLYYIGTKPNSHGTVYEAEFDGEFRLSRPRAVMFHDKLAGLEGIAVDYITGNIYLADSQRNAIVVCKTEPNICVTLIENLKNPRAIAVLPQRGKLFWTQWGTASQNGIYQSNMDGSNVTLLIGDLSWPNGLTYDENRNRLYWTDGKSGHIEYYDFDIELRHSVYEDHTRHPYMIHVFEDNLYWSDWSRDELMVQDKISGHNLRPMIFNSLSHFLGLAVYHPLLQKSGHNPCSLNPCSHVCLMKNPTDFTCACPDHMKLINKYTCDVNQDEPYILASTGRKLFKFYTSEIQSAHSEEIRLPSQVLIGDLTYDYPSQKLYIYDTRSVSIGRIEQNRGRLRYEKLVIDDIDMVVSLHFEVNTRSLYWIDYILNTVEVFSVDRRRRLTLFNKIAKPISLALDSVNRLMYIGSRAHPAKIYSSFLDGTSLRKILETRMNGIPIAMVKRSRSLVWADPTFAKIEEIVTVGSTVVGLPRKLNSRPIGSIHSMDRHNQTLFWSDADSPKVFYSNMLSSSASFFSTIGTQRRIFSRDLPDVGSFNTEDVRLIVVKKEKVILNDCLNNTCAHLCLIGQRGPKCRCEDGFFSNDDGKTCLEDKNVHVLHIPHTNQTQALTWILKSFDDIFNNQPNNETEGDDYYAMEASEMVQDSLPSPKISANKSPFKKINKVESDKAKIVETHDLEHPQIGPKHSPWKFVWIFLILLTVAIVFSLIKFPNLRDTVINVRVSPNLLNRNTSATRFFRNPNYEIGVVRNENVAIGTEINKLEDDNGNLL